MKFALTNNSTLENRGAATKAHPAGHRGSALENPRFFLVSIFVLLVSLVLWAGLANIDQVVRVEGKIIPAGRSQKIQHLEGGIIAAINATEGSSVKKGDLLLTIDNTTADVDLGETQLKLNSARARAARLQAEAIGKEDIVFPPDLVGLPITEAERSLFLAEKNKLSHEISIHQDTVRQRNADITEAQQRRLRLLNEQTTAQQRLDMMRNMAAQGAASKIEVLEAQSRMERLSTEIGAAQDSLPRLQAAIAEEGARIETTKADFSSQAHTELVATLADVDRYKQGMTAASDRLKRTEIRAPIDGVINRIAVNTVGGVVKPGEDLIELIPQTDQILIEARARPHDRGDLHKGSRAQVRVSSYDAGELGQLEGQVTEVSPDSMQDAHSDPYYQVNILVTDLPPTYHDHPMVPGMTVTADIVTGHRTVLAYLLSPLRRFSYTIFRDPR